VARRALWTLWARRISRDGVRWGSMQHATHSSKTAQQLVEASQLEQE
jgi:hypothetical protein